MPNRWSTGIVIPQQTSLLRVGDPSPFRPEHYLADASDYCKEISAQSAAQRPIDSCFKVELGYSKAQYLYGAPMLATFPLDGTIGCTIPSVLYCFGAKDAATVDRLFERGYIYAWLARYMSGNGYHTTEYSFTEFQRRWGTDMIIGSLSGPLAQSIYGCDTVYYPSRPPNAKLAAIELAYLYINNAHSDEEEVRCGLQYLDYLRRSKIVTPLMPKIEAIIMRAIGVDSMDKVLPGCLARTESRRISRSRVRDGGRGEACMTDAVNEDLIEAALATTADAPIVF